ncbi:chromosome segregation protein [Catenulispora sp. GAS73]|uniref:hypothetical protein n=1 Tax=Catenulispora sp. GAS73 TaxID=3156269 RepID=UPI0035163F06
MTTTATNETGFGLPNDRLGVIGERQLIAVQTMDIARLTAHPVALIPETFIAITGMGPVDSNESGKTSFLSASALLLGDPEWRVAGTGVSSVTSMLFEPIVAGITAPGSAATEGYIVGLFADPAEPVASAYTVWMKISAGRPHLQVRHGPGSHLARGVGDGERHKAAPAVYKSLPMGPLGSTEYATTLYGRSPRVLAYVASRGRVRSRPSLLKLDAGTFSPEEIGDALMALSGRITLFERDQQDRQDLAAKQEELERHIRDSHGFTEREDEILRQVDARKRIRTDAHDARSHFRASQARAVLDTYARAESAARLLSTATADLNRLSGQLETLETQREELRDLAGLERALALRVNELAQANGAFDQASARAAELASQLSSQERAAREARIKAAGHDLDRDGSPQEAARARDEWIGKLAVAKQDLEEADNEVACTEEALARAAEGQFGPAGAVMRILEVHGIPAVSLAESVSIEPSHRSVWEARLFPWRDAVCVPDEYLKPALAALAEHPGSMVFAGPAHSEKPAGLPTGIRSAPELIAPFLFRLSSHAASLDPVPHASVLNTGVFVVGGFKNPVIGRDELTAHLEQCLVEARNRAAESLSLVSTLTNEVSRARIKVERAEAAHKIVLLAPEIEALTGQLNHQRKVTVPPLQEARNTAFKLHADAESTLRNRKSRLDQIFREVRSTEKALREKGSETDRLRQASRPDDTVLAAWGRGLEAARAELKWPEAPLTTTEVTHLVDEAMPPIGVQGNEKPERRSVAALLTAAQSQLGAALGTVRTFTGGTGQPPLELIDLADSYTASLRNGDEKPVRLEPLLDLLDGWLDEHSDRDLTAHEEVAKARTHRAETAEFVGSRIRELQQALIQTQEAISQRASGALNSIGEALNRLNRASEGGLGAELEHELTPPVAPDQPWTCRVVPRWRRNPGGPMLAYDNVTNTAQEKLFSIHLVLAALLAAPNPRGRVLILDELADSLGAEHRREVLHAIASVAKEHGITILATCQDSIMVEARPYCREVLYFHYPSRSEALNLPTRMFGLDPNGDRIELTADALIEGRGIDGTPFLPLES